MGDGLWSATNGRCGMVGSMMEETKVENVERPPPERTCQHNSIQKQKLKFTASKKTNVSTRTARTWPEVIRTHMAAHTRTHYWT